MLKKAYTPPIILTLISPHGGYGGGGDGGGGFEGVISLAWPDPTLRKLQERVWSCVIQLLGFDTHQVTNNATMW